MFVPFDRLAGYLSDEALFDEDLQGFYARALVELEKVSKELKILRGITTQKYLTTKEELMRVKCMRSVTIVEETQCSECKSQIGVYPFCYEIASGRIVHVYCYS
jgi:hypothetical protein